MPENKPLPELHNGHAWLLKWLYDQFKVEPFQYDAGKGTFEGCGKGIAAEAEQDNIARWFGELVEHRAIGLHPSFDPVKDEVGKAPWQVLKLPSVTDGVLSFDADVTVKKLVDDLLTIIPREQFEGAACVALKGNSVPGEFLDAFQKGLVAHGAREDVLVVCLPPGASLSFLSEKHMNSVGWEKKKSNLWKPGDPLPENVRKRL